MAGVAWSCRGCDALVEPELRFCHRCGARRDSFTPEEPPERGTPAEFVTAVYRSSIEPLPPRGPIDDTVPTATEVVKHGSRTVPEVPIFVPPPRPPRPPPPVDVKPRRRLGWALAALVAALLAGGWIAFVTSRPFRQLVRGLLSGVS